MNALILTLICFPFATFGQTDTTKKKVKYEYEICVYYKEKYKPTLIKNEIKGIADTTIVSIEGRVYDYNNNSVEYAVYAFDNHKDSIKKGGLTDSLGDFKVFLPADNYELNVRSIGYTNFTLDKLQLRSGEKRQMEIRLGNTDGFKTYSIESDKPLDEKALKRTERRLKRRTNNYRQHNRNT